MAVLNFQNLSRDSANSYLAQGLPEMIHARLTKVDRLSLQSRTLARMGRRPNAAFLVGGTMLRNGDSLVVTVELTNTTEGTVAWSDRFERSPTSVLDIEREVAAGVAQAVLPDLTSAERRVLGADPTRDRVAYDLYLRALSFFRGAYAEVNFRRTIELCEQAVGRDPTFALAYVLIAQSWVELTDNWLPPDSTYPKATAAVRRALTIDSSLPEAHVALASALIFQWDLTGGEREAALALALGPHLAEAEVAASFVPAMRGHLDEALVHTWRAWQLDSLSYYAAVYHLVYLYIAKRPDAIDAFLREAGMVVPETDGPMWRGVALLLRGRCAEAVAILRSAAGFGPSPAMWRARAFACAGRPLEARTILDSLAAASRVHYVEPDAIAAIYAALGERDSAFEWLERGYRGRAGWLVWLNVWPEWDGVRDDPRFQALLRRVGVLSLR